MRQSLITMLDHPRLPFFAALLAVFLALPSLGSGLAVDDWFHRAQIDPTATILPHVRSPILDLFAFFPADATIRTNMVERGILPWWTQPDIQGAFFRPLSALTHLFDWRVVGDHVALHHAHSLLWLALSILSAALLFRTWLGPGRAAALATLFFAMDDAHAWPATWLANRNSLLAMTFGALTGAAFLRASRGSKTAKVLTPFLLVLSLLSAEAGSATVLMLLIFEAATVSSLQERIKRLLPSILVFLTWALVWRGLGYGIHGSGLYIDPIGTPKLFMANIPERLGALSASLWLNMPIDFWVLLPSSVSIPLGLFLGTLSAGVVWLIGRGSVHSREGSASALASALALAILALLPACAAFPMERVLTFAGFGAAAFLGLHLAPLTLPQAQPRRRDLLIFGWHGPLSALLFAVKCIAMPSLLSQMGEDPLPDDPTLAQQDLIFVSAIELSTAYIPIAREFKGLPVPAHQLLLAPAATPLHITREDLHTLKVEMPEGSFNHAIERLCRSDAFMIGETVKTHVATISVLSVDTNGSPTAIRVHFARPLEDPAYRWLAPDDFNFQPWQPPAIGISVDMRPLIALP